MNTNRREFAAFLVGAAVSVTAALIWNCVQSVPTYTSHYYDDAIVQREAAQKIIDEARHKCSGRDPFCYSRQPGMDKYIKQANAKGILLKDFKKLIVYYPTFFVSIPYPLWKPSANILHFDQFNNLLLGAIKETFGDCLITPQGKEKEIEIVAGDDRFMMNGSPAFGAKTNDDELKIRRSLDDIFNPENLTVVLNVEYMVQHRDWKNIENSQYLASGIAKFHTFRPFLPEGNRSGGTSGTIMFGEDIDKNFDIKLRAFFESIAPRECKPKFEGSVITF